MTTITFEEELNLGKLNFKDLFDFQKYLEDNFFVTKLEPLDESEITPELRKKIEETKKMDISEFTDI